MVIDALFFKKTSKEGFDGNTTLHFSLLVPIKEMYGCKLGQQWS